MRKIFPSPQLFEQEDQSPKGPHLQSILQRSVLQTICSIAFPSHSLPPFDAGISCDLDRVFMPPPHLSEHTLHSVNTPQTQSTEKQEATS